MYDTVTASIQNSLVYHRGITYVREMWDRETTADCDVRPLLTADSKHVWYTWYTFDDTLYLVYILHIYTKLMYIRIMCIMYALYVTHMTYCSRYSRYCTVYSWHPQVLFGNGRRENVSEGYIIVNGWGIFLMLPYSKNSEHILKNFFGWLYRVLCNVYDNVCDTN